jgi:hypothetical protein
MAFVQGVCKGRLYRVFVQVVCAGLDMFKVPALKMYYNRLIFTPNLGKFSSVKFEWYLSGSRMNSLLISFYLGIEVFPFFKLISFYFECVKTG